METPSSSSSSLRRSKREHQPSAKAAASSASSSSLPPPASSSGGSRRSQRRRVTTRSASPAPIPAPPARNPSPVQVTVTSPASPSDRLPVVVDAVGPNGQRRRVRAAAHSSGTHGVHSAGGHKDGKVLGKYSSRDCTRLCEVILGQLKTQTMAPTVLDEDKSPAFIRWGSVAKKMETTHKLRLTPKECQALWKFLAYGKTPASEEEKEEELLPDSEEEDFYKTPKEVNAQILAARREKAAVESVESAEKVKREQVDAAATSGEEEPQQDNNGESGAGQDEGTQETERESSLRLYPTYSLPTGAPDAWYRPFGPKDALPLTFVASRFLRRKPTPTSAQSLVGKPAVTPGSNAAGQSLTADLKRKQVMATDSVAASKKPKLPTPTVSTPPRVYTPSSTPPPAATRAKSELEFFERRLREELVKKTPGSTFELSAADIQRRYGEASAKVRRECQVLAAHDVERFNREVVRVRIWQKAMGNGSMKPSPTLAPTPAPASKPDAATVSKPGSTVAVGASATNSSTAPAIAKSSGTTAALLAHVAAVATTAAKANSTTPTSSTTSAPAATQEQKDGAQGSAKTDSN